MDINITHNIFICYSRDYTEYRDFFINSINPATYNYDFKLFYDTNFLLPGDDYEKSIIDVINTCQIVVLIITKDFFNKDFIREKELVAIKNADKVFNLRIIPIIVHRDVNWEIAFGHLNALPLHGTKGNVSSIEFIKTEEPEKKEQVIWNDVIKDIIKNIPKLSKDNNQIKFKSGLVHNSKKLIPNLELLNGKNEKELAEKIVFLLKYTIFSLSHSVINKYQIMTQLGIGEEGYMYLIKGKEYTSIEIQKQYNMIVSMAIKYDFFKSTQDAVDFYQLNLGTYQEIYKKSYLILKEHTHFINLIQQYAKRLYMKENWGNIVSKIGKVNSRSDGLNSPNEKEALKTMTEIYTQANLLWKRSDMNLFVVSDFDNNLWDNIIDKSQEYIENNLNKENKKTHLHFANTFIGEQLSDYITEERKVKLSKGTLNKTFKVVEGGVGGANTSHKVLETILSKCDKEINFEKLHYIGFEVNQVFAEQADTIFKGNYKQAKRDNQPDPRSNFFGSLEVPKLVPLTCSYTETNNKFVFNEDLSQGIWRIHNDYSKDKFITSFKDIGSVNGDIDLFLFSYVFHHVSNGNALRKILFSGLNNTKLLQPNFFNDKVFKNRLRNVLHNYISDCYEHSNLNNLEIKGDIFDSESFSINLADSILELLPLKDELFSKFDAQELIDELDDFTNSFLGKTTFPSNSAWINLTINHQERLINQVWDLLKPGGYLAIADPDGYSKFNKINIPKNAEMGVAHFLNRREMCTLLKRAGFRFNIIGAWTQVKEGEQLDVIVESQDSYEISTYDTVDYNLGYIIIAQKPFNEKSNKFYKRQGDDCGT